MINKETITDCLELISIAAGLTLSDKDIERKIILFSHPEIFGEYEDNDFKKATIEIIKNETFYNKIPQPVTFREYCQKEKDKRLSEKKARELEIVKNEKQKLISTIYKFFEISRGDYLFNLASEFRSYNTDQIRQAFNNLKDIDRPQIEDWRKELNKKETTNEAKNWVMPNLKANRI